jgi:hypothetical protein
MVTLMKSLGAAINWEPIVTQQERTIKTVDLSVLEGNDERRGSYVEIDWDLFRQRN